MSAFVKASIVFALAGPYLNICASEHMSARRFQQAQQIPLAGGFLSTSNLENPKELRELIVATFGSTPISRGSSGDFGSVSASLDSMWRSLAKNKEGRVDHRSLRFAVHRYLLKNYGLSITGLEPTVASDEEEPLVLRTHAPALVREALEGATAGEGRGFSKEDAVAMIFMLEHFVKILSEPRVRESFKLWGADEDERVQKKTLQRIIESGFFELILGGDEEGIAMLRENATLGQEFFEDWESLVGYVHGRIENHLRAVQRSSLRTSMFFEDAVTIAGDMTLTMGRFWELECARVRDLLSGMDRTGTGRIRLADFHHAALNGEWRFSESKEYLRHLGALDETSTLAGPRVIIANYAQGPSNCIVSTPNYRICCMSDCENHLSAIEDAVSAPSAEPEQILAVVSNITSWDDEKAVISAKVRNQLLDIAKVHSGVVPLHGRLFGQWLHYVFPRDCAYPHKSGTTGTLSFFEFGEDSLASTGEIKHHAAIATRNETSRGDLTDTSAQRSEEEDWLSQWSHEEELVSNLALFQAPWETSSGGSVAWAGLLLLTGLAYMLFVVSPHVVMKQCSQVLHQCCFHSVDVHAHII